MTSRMAARAKQLPDGRNLLWTLKQELRADGTVHLELNVDGEPIDDDELERLLAK